jgi:hypothetical protein
MSGMDLFILIGLVVFLICSSIALLLFTIWAAGRNSNRGGFEF